MSVGEIRVDVCRGGCGGIWFDRFELDKVDEPDEAPGELLYDIDYDPELQVNPTKRRSCPHCEDAVMMRHFFSVKRAVAVDECPACGGFWLDRGELQTIRSLFGSEEERARAGEEYFDRIFGGQLEQMRRESEEKHAKALAFAKLFRFICPSTYIPGKQSWGAF
ncbi:MAG: zf-TFIIB domain-containing protein [Candidatus Eisenbacteria bacterium]|nr:zf-TFIIB domain-containing protein [Candidatus Eisenbacteria bacterium]